MLKQCSPPPMLLLTRKKAKYAVSYASIKDLTLAPDTYIPGNEKGVGR